MNHAANTEFSLIIIVKNREQHLRNVLKALTYSTYQPSEVIVVRMNEAEQPLGLDVRQIELRSEHPLPLALARNTGARHAQYDHLIFLDVDCIPAENCFEMLLDSTTDGVVTMVDPQYLDSPVETINLASLASRAHPNVARGDVEYGESDRYELFWSLGFCVTKSTYELIDGFDERYIGYGGEDTDFAYMLRDAGVKLNFSKARVYHQPHGTISPPLNWLEDILSNAKVFRSKWHVWPMTGWLDAFSERGYIEYDTETIRILRLPSEDEIQAASVSE